MQNFTLMVKPVSGACNMRCGYCFYADEAQCRTRPSMGVMDAETAETLVRRTVRYAGRSASFVFQGGEPTLAGAEFFDRFAALERQYNTAGLWLSHSIQTNGYNLSDEMLDVLEREKYLVGVSLDGTPTFHDRLRRDASGEGTSERVIASLEKLQSRGLETHILCVITKDVAEAPESVFDALAGYGYLQFIPCIPPFSGETAPWALTPSAYGEFLIRTFERYAAAFFRGKPVSVRTFDNYIGILLGRVPETCAMCGQCAPYALVEADGSVYPCDFYALDQWRIGNIREESFFRMEKSPVWEKFLRDSLYVDPSCGACPWYRMCRGGCRRDREPFTDGRPGLNRWCESYRAFFSACFPTMQRMAEKL